jgi:hypothetical protein
MASIPLKTLSTFAFSVAFLTVGGCHNNQQQQSATSTDNTQPQQVEQPSSDPASANLAAVASGGTGQESSSAEVPGSDQNYSAQEENLPPAEDSADESDYGIQPEETALQPPPPLPEYDQPPCPGDGYIWTPGYWNYASAGYYWVPGAWVQAPYEGALWTPGYWAYNRGRYDYYHGYWARHIGFYGGINYGFGYTGFGYRGGYWNGDRFDYNRSVNNVNTTVIRNVYNYRIVNNYTVTRVSYNGGNGGIQARPRLAELAALREPHVPPMRNQVDLRSSAMSNRAQFASANHGRPTQVAYSGPVAAENNVRPVTPHLHNLPPMRTLPERAAAPAGRAEPNRPEADRAAPAPARPENRAAPTRPELNRAAPTNRVEPIRVEPNRATPNRATPNRAEPHRMTPNRSAPNRAETNRAEPNRAEPNRTQPNRTEPGRTEPNRTEQPHVQTHANPQHSERAPAHTPTGHAQPENRKSNSERHDENQPHL